MKSRLRLWSVVALSLAASSSVAAQKLEERLEAVKILSCVFTAQAKGNWTGGTAKVDVVVPKLSLEFYEIDTDEGTAKAKGEFGSSDILVRVASGTLHLLQSFRTGPLHVTSVFARETQPGRLLAVHTRHEFTAVALPGFTSRPEQYYGDCELKP
jgi:hypothetical protein